MPRLGEVLGGLLADVVRARVAADLQTAQALSVYRDDPVMQAMSVPRVTIPDMSITLNFVLSEVEVPSEIPLDQPGGSAMWNDAVRDRMLPRLLERSRDTALARAIAVLRKQLSERPITVEAEVLQSCLDGDDGPLVELTVADLLDREGSGPIADQKDRLLAETMSEARTFRDELVQAQIAGRALQSRLDIDVLADRLSGAPPESVHTIQLSVSMSDVEELVGTTTTGGV
jgi:hypothetical protein